MTFPKDHYIAPSDTGVAHAAARSMHVAAHELTAKRSNRKLPKNMSMFNKAKARAGADLIAAREDRKGTILCAVFASAASNDGDVGFGLGIELAHKVRAGWSVTRATALSISNHCAARVMGRTVHRPDHALLREELRPALELVATAWTRSDIHPLLHSLCDTTQEDAGDYADGSVALVTPRGALLGRVYSTSDGFVQFRMKTWLDAGTAAGREIPALCQRCVDEKLTALMAVRDGGAFRSVLTLEAKA